MRYFVAILLAAVSLQLGSGTADASCLQQTLTEHAQRAEVVAFGTVSAGSFEIKQVLKGEASGTVQVRFGEGGGVVTSIDYMHEDGEHTLYLTRDGSGYATNACTGSHPGVPTAEERAFFGAGEVTSGGTASGATETSGAVTTYAPIALAAALLAAGLVALALIKLRRGATA